MLGLVLPPTVVVTCKVDVFYSLSTTAVIGARAPIISVESYVKTLSMVNCAHMSVSPLRYLLLLVYRCFRKRHVEMK